MNWITSSMSARAPRVAALLLVLLALAGCGGELVGTTRDASNIPVVGMNPGQFGFAITASDWSADRSFSPDLQAGSLQVGLAVASYRGGTGRIWIVDATDATVFTADLAGNIASGNNTTITGHPPYQVRVTASHYSGTISLGVNTAPTPG